MNIQQQQQQQQKENRICRQTQHVYALFGIKERRKLRGISLFSLSILGGGGDWGYFGAAWAVVSEIQADSKISRFRHEI